MKRVPTQAFISIKSRPGTSSPSSLLPVQQTSQPCQQVVLVHPSCHFLPDSVIRCHRYHCIPAHEVSAAAVAAHSMAVDSMVHLFAGTGSCRCCSCASDLRNHQGCIEGIHPAVADFASYQGTIRAPHWARVVPNGLGLMEEGDSKGKKCLAGFLSK